MKTFRWISLGLVLAALASVTGSCHHKVQADEERFEPASKAEARGLASSDLEEPTEEEVRLWQLVNQYRAGQGLPAISLSRSLTQVAKTHVRDLNASPPSGSCNMHSWSSGGAWTPCCYTSDHAKAQCMWDKPKELTRYSGNGFENAVGGAGVTMDAEGALESWQGSPGHNAVILNQGIWADNPWQSLGVGLERSYAVLWFGQESDPDGYWRK